MQTSTRPRNRLLMGFGGLAIVVLMVVSPGVAGAAPSASSNVLSASYAKAIGFTKTVEAAKAAKVTSQKGCTESYEAVYEDAASQTGLVSETLQCNSKAAATKALTTARKQIKVDSSFKAPKKLGSTAFVTATNAPEYLLAWVAGSKVAITAIDVDIAASTSTSTSSTVAPAPLTSAQMKILTSAALKQNSLYS